MSRVHLTPLNLDDHPRGSRPLEVWLAEFGETWGVGSTRAAALRDLADRLDVRESVSVAGGELPIKPDGRGR